MPKIIYRTANWAEKALLEWIEFKPVLSILFIVATLLGLVFVQMEERRMGYAIFKLSKGYREKVDERRGLEIQLAQSLRLEKLERLAQKRLTLRRAQSHQVIYLNDQNDLDTPLRIPASGAGFVALKASEQKSGEQN